MKRNCILALHVSLLALMSFLCILPEFSYAYIKPHTETHARIDNTFSFPFFLQTIHSTHIALQLVFCLFFFSPGNVFLTSFHNRYTSLQSAPLYGLPHFT